MDILGAELSNAEQLRASSPRVAHRDEESRAAYSAIATIRIDGIDRSGAGCGLAVLFDAGSPGIAARQIGCALRSLGEDKWSLSAYSCSGSSTECGHMSETDASFVMLHRLHVLVIEVENWQISCTAKDLLGSTASTAEHDVSSFVETSVPVGLSLVTFYANVLFETSMFCFAEQ